MKISRCFLRVWFIGLVAIDVHFAHAARTIFVPGVNFRQELRVGTGGGNGAIIYANTQLINASAQTQTGTLKYVHSTASVAGYSGASTVYAEVYLCAAAATPSISATFTSSAIMPGPLRWTLAGNGSIILQAGMALWTTSPAGAMVDANFNGNFELEVDQDRGAIYATSSVSIDGVNPSCTGKAYSAPSTFSLPDNRIIMPPVFVNGGRAF